MQTRSLGTTMPVLDVILAAGEEIIAEGGEVSWLTPGFDMDTSTRFGSGGEGVHERPEAGPRRRPAVPHPVHRAGERWVRGLHGPAPRRHPRAADRPGRQLHGPVRLLHVQHPGRRDLGRHPEEAGRRDLRRRRRDLPKTQRQRDGVGADVRGDRRARLRRGPVDARPPRPPRVDPGRDAAGVRDGQGRQERAVRRLAAARPDVRTGPRLAAVDDPQKLAQAIEPYLPEKTTTTTTSSS